MINLKKCSFCGGDAEIFSTGNYWQTTYYRIHCKKLCCMQGGFYSSEVAAAEEWNRRASNEHRNGKSDF